MKPVPSNGRQLSEDFEAIISAMDIGMDSPLLRNEFVNTFLQNKLVDDFVDAACN